MRRACRASPRSFPPSERLYMGMSVWALIQTTDLQLSAAVHSSPALGPCEYLVYVFSSVFNPSILPFTWAATFLLLPFSISALWTEIIHILLVLLLTTALKRLLARPRPVYNSLRGSTLIYNFRGRETNYSMPSGDSAQAALYWTFLVLHANCPLPIAGICTFATMFARVFYMCHFWGDTVVGAALGVTVACILSSCALS